MGSSGDDPQHSAFVGKHQLLAFGFIRLLLPKAAKHLNSTLSAPTASRSMAMRLTTSPVRNRLARASFRRALFIASALIPASGWAAGVPETQLYDASLTARAAHTIMVTPTGSLTPMPLGDALVAVAGGTTPAQVTAIIASTSIATLVGYVDPTNANNLATGTVPVARLPLLQNMAGVLTSGQLPPSTGSYTLPVAGSALGGVKNGGNVTVAGDGTMTAPAGGGGTTYTAGAGITITGAVIAANVQSVAGLTGAPSASAIVTAIQSALNSAGYLTASTIPAATGTTIGGFIPGTGLSMSGNVLNATGGGSSIQAPTLITLTGGTYTLPAGVCRPYFSGTVTNQTIVLPSGLANNTCPIVMHFAGQIGTNGSDGLTFSPGVNGWPAGGTANQFGPLAVEYDGSTYWRD